MVVVDPAVWQAATAPTAKAKKAILRRMGV
jgi:hypothetical protein